jgi:type 1 glutamine amidotransferase
MPSSPRPGGVLLFTRTTDYRHDSIPAGVAALSELAAGEGLTPYATEDPEVFSTGDLASYAAVVFLSTSGDVLNHAGRAALERYVGSGGGFLGVHAAACTEYEWPYYGQLVGARFDAHPHVQPAVVTVEDADHPATAHLPLHWEWTDEWYDFRANPRPGVRVLATVDERLYEGGTMGDDHPLVWCRRLGGGRTFYTALGHDAAAYADPAFRAHLLGALRWVTG